MRFVETENCRNYCIPPQLSKNNIVYFCSCDNHLYAVSAKTREILWKFKTGNEEHGDITINSNMCSFGSTDQYFYCLDLDDSLIWKYCAGEEFFMGAPAVSENIVYAGASDGCDE